MGKLSQSTVCTKRAVLENGNFKAIWLGRPQLLCANLSLVAIADATTTDAATSLQTFKARRVRSDSRAYLSHAHFTTSTDDRDGTSAPLGGWADTYKCVIGILLNISLASSRACAHTHMDMRMPIRMPKSRRTTQ